MTRPRPLAIVALGFVAISLALAAWAAPASAQVTAAPPLTGETFTAQEGLGGNIGTIEVQSDCGLTSPQISWTATGIAAGLYAGPYSETGTAVLASTGGPVTGLTATFTIDSMIGDVEGTKTFSMPFGGASLCLSNQQTVEALVTYTAEITTITGTCTTEGTASVFVYEQGGVLPPGERFFEHFLTGTPPVCIDLPLCPPDDDDDGDGLSDRRENLLGTLLGKADSDGDGIVDGNDDANRNGEDDEDEDDGDGCPDEDSDDDGEDDEDEDDDEEGDDD